MQVQETSGLSFRDIAANWPMAKSETARRLCVEFLKTAPSSRFVFGQNIYAKAITSKLAVAGVVDDFTLETETYGVPIVRTKDLPENAFVLAASGGKPLTVRRLLDQRKVRQIDYFTFLRWSGLDLPEVVFNEGFGSSFQADRTDAEWLYNRLADQQSRDIFVKLMGFRFSYDIDWLHGFTDRQNQQYFEEFLDLRRGEPVFVDVGGFDGFTSEEFIRRCPGYHAVFVFEPDPGNIETCRQRLGGYHDVSILPYGAGDKTAKLRFSADGSASRFSDEGESLLEVRRIDDLVKVAPTLIKMDIEGAELSALRGAKQVISTHRPPLAICVYHRPTDFWEIPKTVLDMVPEYKVYMRHYTECIYETVMYFLPPEKK
jgi:FkbM family methyltransferase